MGNVKNVAIMIAGVDKMNMEKLPETIYANLIDSEGLYGEWSAERQNKSNVEYTKKVTSTGLEKEVNYDEKFIVYNRKIFNGLRVNHNSFVNAFGDFLREMEDLCRIEGITIDNKYIVCNQDEPYADEVLKLILDGEQEKKNEG